jgi:hypothetical protein
LAARTPEHNALQVRILDDDFLPAVPALHDPELRGAGAQRVQPRAGSKLAGRSGKNRSREKALHKADEDLFRDLKLIAGDAIRRSERATASKRGVYLRDMEGCQTDGG